jgi:hypothetical protein
MRSRTDASRDRSASWAGAPSGGVPSRRAEDARQELVGLLEGLDRTGTSVMALAGVGRAPVPWTLYPGEYGIYDRRTRCQFYYHVHPEAAHEAGHFHTVRLFPDRTVHVVGISMAPTGWPQALFTVNLWAVGDAYAPPAEVARHAREFRVSEQRGPATLVRFVNLVFRAFLPEIQRLQDEKEHALVACRAAHPDADPFADRSLEVLSRADIDLRRSAGGRRL